MLSERVFNFHDLVQIVVILECIALAAYHFSLEDKACINRRIIALFMLVIGTEATINLVMWNPALTISPFFNHHVLPVLFVMAQLLRGPLFLAYVMTFSTTFMFKKRHLLHLLPILCLLTIIVLYSLSSEQLRFRDGIADPASRFAANFIWYSTSVITLTYGAAALVSIQHYRARLQQQFSDYDPALITWLQLLTFCFGIAWTWSFFVVYMASLYGGLVADNLGTFYNYILFAVTNGLIAYSYYNSKPAALEQNEHQNVVADVDSKNQIIAKINSALTEKNMHLMPNLNIEQFANAMGEPVKLVSHIINHELQTNFFELINTKRIDVAKSLLADPSMQHITVLEISLMSGFNNKSSFHRFFNRIAGVSPTQFRKQHSQHHCPLKKVSGSQFFGQ
ncbi:MAG: helix-turn-helix domain-containing protein [Aestuariibacter sp.]